MDSVAVHVQASRRFVLFTSSSPICPNPGTDSFKMLMMMPSNLHDKYRRAMRYELFRWLALKPMAMMLFQRSTCVTIPRVPRGDDGADPVIV